MSPSQPPDLFNEIVGEEEARPRGIHMYSHKHAWGKQSNWIVVTPANPTDKANYEGRGFRFLPEYSRNGFAMGTTGGAPGEKDKRGAPWNPAADGEQYRLIFQLDGAKEFPVDQVVAYNWHIRPPYRGIVFPQIDALSKDKKPTSFQCPQCEDERFFSHMDRRQAARMLRNHLTSGVKEGHRWSIADIQEVFGDKMKINFDTDRTTDEIKEVEAVEKPARKRNEKGQLMPNDVAEPVPVEA